MNKGSTGFFFLLCIFLLSVAMVSRSQAQQDTIIGDIRIRGLSVFPTEEVLTSFITKIGQKYVPAIFHQDLDRLIRRYRDDGYFYARVDSVSETPGSGALDLTVHFHEGKQSVIDTVRFSGNSALSDEKLARHLMFTRGSPFIQSQVEDGAHAILQAYEDVGYPFAKVVVDSVVMNETATQYPVAFTYEIDEGRTVRVQELRVVGNTTTRTSVIVREARLGGDEFYSQRLSEAVRRRLERLQLFSSVSMPELFLDQKDEGGLLVKVQEGNPNRFDGIVGYVPSPRPGVSGFFTGLVDLQFRNLFGTGRRFAARWYRENQSTQELGLQYYEPWIASYPVNGEIGFVQRIQDSTYVRRKIDLALDFSLNDQLSIGAVFSRTNVIPSQSYGRTVLAESQGTSIGVTIAYDTRNDPVTPLSGLYYKSEYDLGTKDAYASTYFQASSASTQRVLMDLDYYLEPFSAQVIAAGLHIEDLRSNLIELGDLFRLGGAGTLRGYREGQFLGSSLVWSNLEYRFLVAQRSYFFGFVDAGYIVSPSVPLAGIQGSEQTKVGYGIGIRMDTNLGLIGVSIGFGEGDTFSTAKLHIQLINAF